jgi:hypothetical protein
MKQCWCHMSMRGNDCWIFIQGSLLNWHKNCFKTAAVAFIATSP